MANVGQIAALHAVGAMTYRSSTRSEWQNVFFLAAAIYATAAVAFGSGHRQSWANDRSAAYVDKQPDTAAA